MQTVDAIVLFVLAALLFALAAYTVVYYASEGAAEPARTVGGIVIVLLLAGLCLWGGRKVLRGGKRCPECRMPVRSDARRCRHCGASLAA